MAPIMIVRMLASLAALAVILSPAVQAQDRAINSRAAKHTSAPAEPRIIGRSNVMIVEGRITEIRNDLVRIKTARGTRYDFRIDDQTTMLSSDELISIATMSDITLSVSDLRPSDRVEIVAERAARQAVARIITRIASSGEHIASR